ncbi:MAG: Holliday junction branch migration protein RuvA [Candidatus Sumerlaeia bacterium]
MIEYLKGTLIRKEIGHVVILAGGVGYGVSIPLSTFEALPSEGDEAALWIYHHSVDGESHLFGFARPEGREIFSILISVSGVGPKLALKMMSSLTIEAFTAAIAAGDVAALTGVPGIGRKTAERLILELKDKLARHAAAVDRTALETVASQTGQGVLAEEAVAALVGLDLPLPTARALVSRALSALGPGAAVEDVIRHCLKKQS